MECLKEYVTSLWGQFDLLELNALQKSESKDYKAVN